MIESLAPVKIHKLQRGCFWPNHCSCNTCTENNFTRNAQAFWKETGTHNSTHLLLIVNCEGWLRHRPLPTKYSMKTVKTTTYSLTQAMLFSHLCTHRIFVRMIVMHRKNTVCVMKMHNSCCMHYFLRVSVVSHTSHERRII